MKAYTWSVNIVFDNTTIYGYNTTINGCKLIPLMHLKKGDALNALIRSLMAGANAEEQGAQTWRAGAGVGAR